MSTLVSPLTNLSRAAEPADVASNSSDIAALTTALGAKADQTVLDTTNTAVHTKADASAVTNNIALISALQTGKADQSSLTSTDAIVGAHTTSLNALGGRMTTAESNISTQTTNIGSNASLIVDLRADTAGIEAWPMNTSFYSIHHPSALQNVAGNYALLCDASADTIIGGRNNLSLRLNNALTSGYTHTAT